MKTIDARGYCALSKGAVYLLSRSEYEGRKVITTEYAVGLLGSYRSATNMLDRLCKKNRLIQLGRGRYIAVPLKAPNQLWVPNEYVMASFLMGEIPYYIGYSSMYNYWGFTEQMPQTITILNTMKEWKRNIKNIRYIAIKVYPAKMYGISGINIEGENVVISDKERTLVDFIFKPMGSWENVQTVINSQISNIDLGKFLNYLIRFPVMAVRKRAGIMLEKSGVSSGGLDELKKSAGSDNTYTNFNPFIRSRKGKINREWKIIING